MLLKQKPSFRETGSGQHHETMPILIPAYKGFKYIDRTLESLPRHGVEPTVVVNGENDGTVERARQYGANVLHIEEAGKLPALQEALRKMGKGALRPLAIMDVDTRIVAPNKWLSAANDALDVSMGPLYMTGPIAFTNKDLLNAIARTAWYARKATSKGGIQTPSDLWLGQNHYGPNTILRLSDEDTLDAVLELPHYWPGEDRAMAETVVAHDGSFFHNSDPRMLAITPLSESYDPLIETVARRILGRVTGKPTAARYVDSYTNRGATGSQTYPHLNDD